MGVPDGKSGFSAPFGLYVHWPFCKSKCPYCDFNSHVHDAVDHQAWRDALVQELRYFAELTPGRTLDSIFFGGGTPSLMLPETVAAVIDVAQRAWIFSNDIEITLEANPTSVEAGKFAAFRQAGINRVSLGIQSFRDDDLTFLGRQHSAAEGRRAIDIAAATFDRFSYDLIYARPQQSPDAWAAELEEALAVADAHISLYQLTIEPGTAFFTRHARGEFDIPNEIRAGEMYEITQDILGAAGMPAYEISNHARPGQESRHNLVYWRYGDYVGIGPGAHGRLGIDGKKQATRTHRAPDIWLKQVQERGSGAQGTEIVTPDQRLVECVMMGLRLAEELPWSRLERESGKSRDAIFKCEKLRSLGDEGYLVTGEGGLTTTPAGRQRLDALLAYLLD